MLFKFLKNLQDEIYKSQGVDPSCLNNASTKAMEVLEMYYALHHPLEYLITKTNDSD